MNLNDIKQQYQMLLQISAPQSEEQKLILMLHAIMLSQAFICTGLEEDDPEDEFLCPQQWNQPKNQVYSFRYKKRKDLKEAGKSIYVKILCEREFMDYNLVREEKNDVIVSTSFKK